MSLFTPSIVPLVLIAILVVTVLGLHGSRSKATKPTRWEVKTAATANWLDVRYDEYAYYGKHEKIKHEKINVNHTVQVRLIGPGSDVVIGTIHVAADDYEVQLKDAIQKAEERAQTLNALVLL